MKVKVYTEPVMVRLSKKGMSGLKNECKRLQMDEAVYGREAIRLCLKEHLVKSRLVNNEMEG